MTKVRYFLDAVTEKDIEKLCYNTLGVMPAEIYKQPNLYYGTYFSVIFPAKKEPRFIKRPTGILMLGNFGELEVGVQGLEGRVLKERVENILSAPKDFAEGLLRLIAIKNKGNTVDGLSFEEYFTQEYTKYCERLKAEQLAEIEKESNARYNAFISLNNASDFPLKDLVGGKKYIDDELLR